MKTGTLKRVKNIGGYVKNKAGKYYTAVILINSTKARYRGAKLQNEIMKWLVGSRAKASRQSVPPKAKTVSNVKITKPVKQRPAVKKTPKKIHNQKMIKKPSGRYYIQVGVFGKKPNSKYFQKITRAGFIHNVRRGKNVRVFVGRYKDKKSAQRDLAKVRKQISSGAFIVKL